MELKLNYTGFFTNGLKISNRKLSAIISRNPKQFFFKSGFLAQELPSADEYNMERRPGGFAGRGVQEDLRGNAFRTGGFEGRSGIIVRKLTASRTTKILIVKKCSDL